MKVLKYKSKLIIKQIINIIADKTNTKNNSLK